MKSCWMIQEISLAIHWLRKEPEFTWKQETKYWRKKKYGRRYSLRASSPIPHSRGHKRNGNKLSAQRFQLGSFGWTSNSYDWSMVFKETMNQSQVTLVHPNDPKTRYAESLYQFPLQFLQWGIWTSEASRARTRLFSRTSRACTFYDIP